MSSYRCSLLQRLGTTRARKSTQWCLAIVQPEGLSRDRSDYFIKILEMNENVIINAVSGGSAGFIADSIFYGLDSFKTQSQMKGGSLRSANLFKGLIPLAFLGSVPSFGLFFAVYESTKQSMEYNGYKASAVVVASFAGGVPASIVAVPADLIKKRVVVGVADSPSQAIQQVLRLQGVKGLFTGWQLNLSKDIPFAILKLSIFETCINIYSSYQHHELTPNQRTACGVASGAITAILTNPLDVINTRMKTSSNIQNNTMSAFYQQSVFIVREEGPVSLIKGLPQRLVIISLGSGVFWGSYSHIKHVLTQFL